MSIISVEKRNTNYIKIRVSGMTSTVATVNFYQALSSDSKNAYITFLGSSNFVLDGSTYYCDYIYYGLSPFTEYRFVAATYNSGGNRLERLETSTITRPSNWNWYSVVSKNAEMPYTKSADGKTITCTPLSASEWKLFVDRIYEFLAYKGVSTSISASSLYVTRGTDMLAADVDKARDLIGLMTDSLPAAASSGGGITAAYINGLKNSLNSIT